MMRHETFEPDPGRCVHLFASGESGPGGAFIEAANVICRSRRCHPGRHVSRLYNRLHRRKGHQKAAGAVARHLAEATYWMLKKHQPSCEPKGGAVSSRGR